MAFEVKKVFQFHAEAGFISTGPWTIAFVYPRKEKPFIVKGRFQKVADFIVSEVTRAIIYYTIFNKKVHRTQIAIHTASPLYRAFLEQNKKRTIPRERNRKWKLTVISKASGETVFQKSLRRPPRRWPKELDRFVFCKEPEVIPCAGCSEVIVKTENGHREIIGCKLSRFAKLGKNCPLNNLVGEARAGS